MRLTDFATIAGWSVKKLLADSDIGQLQDVYSQPCGRRVIWMVSRAAARRYIEAIDQQRAARVS